MNKKGQTLGFIGWITIIVIGLSLIQFIFTLIFGTFFHFGTGKTYGYVDTVEDGIYFTKVYIKPKLESSQEDCFIADKNSGIDFDNLAQNASRHTFTYDRYFSAMASDCFPDVITKVD